MHLISLIEHLWLDTVRTVPMTSQVVQLLLSVSLAPPLRVHEGCWEEGGEQKHPES